MQFKIDENLPVEVASLLINAGHDAKTVNDQNLSGTTDANLISVCRNEQRVLITQDLDFSDIRAYPPKESAGIIVLRARQSKPHILSVLKGAIPLLDKEPLINHLWIVEENKVRIHGA